MIAKYCTEAANASVPHSTLTGTGSSLGSAAHVGCALGYARTASSTSANATCAALNATHGLWRGLNLACARAPSASAFEYCASVYDDGSKWSQPSSSRGLTLCALPHSSALSHARLRIPNPS